jgi:hypothetical protein
MSKDRSIWSIVPNRSITGSDPSVRAADRARRTFAAGFRTRERAERFSLMADPP